MAKLKTNYLIDFLMFLSFIVVAITGVILLPIFPEFGIKRGILIRLHTLSGLVMIILVLIHFLLHWQWIKTMTKNIFTKK